MRPRRTEGAASGVSGREGKAPWSTLRALGGTADIVREPVWGVRVGGHAIERIERITVTKEEGLRRAAQRQSEARTKETSQMRSKKKRMKKGTEARSGASESEGRSQKV